MSTVCWRKATGQQTPAGKTTSTDRQDKQKVKAAQAQATTPVPSDSSDDEPLPIQRRNNRHARSTDFSKLLRTAPLWFHLLPVLTSSFPRTGMAKMSSLSRPCLILDVLPPFLDPVSPAVTSSRYIARLISWYPPTIQTSTVLG